MEACSSASRLISRIHANKSPATVAGGAGAVKGAGKVAVGAVRAAGTAGKIAKTAVTATLEASKGVIPAALEESAAVAPRLVPATALGVGVGGVDLAQGAEKITVFMSKATEGAGEALKAGGKAGKDALHEAVVRITEGESKFAKAYRRFKAGEPLIEPPKISFEEALKAIGGAGEKMEKHHTEIQALRDLFEAKGGNIDARTLKLFIQEHKLVHGKMGLFVDTNVRMAYELSKVGSLYTVSLKTLGEISLYGKAYFHTLLLFAFVGALELKNVLGAACSQVSFLFASKTAPLLSSLSISS